MTAGRPRKPTALHALHGTHRADRHGNGDEPQPAAAGLEAPNWLKAAGRRVWEELAPVVHANGCLTEMDVELFGHACTSLAIARRAPKNVRNLEIANKILARFGMTPSDRAKISVSPPSDDPFDRFLSGRKPK